jgi:hypothetical protein
MGEIAIVALGVALLALLGFVVPMLPAAWLVSGGVVCIVAGMLLGVPTGAAYHVALGRALRTTGELPPRWWLHPVSLHPRIPSERRVGVLLWFAAGGLGFLVTVLGCALVGLGVIVEGFRAGVF